MCIRIFLGCVNHRGDELGSIPLQNDEDEEEEVGKPPTLRSWDVEGRKGGGVRGGSEVTESLINS